MHLSQLENNIHIVQRNDWKFRLLIITSVQSKIILKKMKATL